MAIKSSNLQERERARRKAMSIALPILIVILYFGLVGLSRLTSFDLYTVNVEGNKTIDADYLIKKTTDHCSGTVFLFSKKNILVCSFSSLRTHLLSEWPRIDSLKISRAGFHTVKLRIVEREPVGQTCKDSCLVFDKDGFAFREPLSDESKKLPMWNEVSFVPADFIIPADRFHAISDFLVILTSHIGKIRTVTLVPPDLEIIPESGIKYLFEEGSDLLKAVRNVDEFTANFTKKDPNALKTIESIDARFGNKFFYTLKATSSSEKSIKKELSTATSTKR